MASKEELAARRAYHERYSEWMNMMVGAGNAMPESEKQALLDWEQANLDGHSVGTSDWPGWEKYIGKKPDPSDFQPTK